MIAIMSDIMRKDYREHQAKKIGACRMSHYIWRAP